MRNEREKGYLWISQPSVGGGLGAVVVLEGEGEVGFDVSPGWRRALITEGGKGERMMWIQRSVDELRMARA